MSVEMIAKDVVELNKAGKFEEAGEKYWADDVVSYEAGGGDMAVVKGKEGLRGKSAWWSENFTVDRLEVGGPYVNGDQFVVRFTMSTTNNKTGEKSEMDEVGVYTVKDGKISEERFFYAAP